MRARFALAALTAVLLLTGCDLAGSGDSVSGYWEGTSEFKVDSVLADQNARITADYRMHFTFDLTHDDGLVTGRITARREGMLVYREAGHPADTLRFDADLITNDDEAFGTYIEPELEVDVPEGPYEENMWTFDVAGSSAETVNFIRHLWTFERADGQTFDFGIRSVETFRMRRQSRPSGEDASGEIGGESLQGVRVRALPGVMAPEPSPSSRQ